MPARLYILLVNVLDALFLFRRIKKAEGKSVRMENLPELGALSQT